jgi:hypothetical protein
VGGGPSDRLNGGRGSWVVVLTGEPRQRQRAGQGLCGVEAEEAKRERGSQPRAHL